MPELRHAVPPHKTATTDKPWDGPKAKANLKKDQPAEYYARAFAWRSPDGDPTKKTDWKFIHHEVGVGGEIGAANLVACSAGIAILNGGRGGADIPDGDRHGVYAHLAAHLKDGGKEPPPLRSAGDDDRLERRTFPLTELRIETRDAKDGEPGGKKMVGYAAVFNQKSDPIMGMFRETIRPGAFSKTIQEADVRALFNHNPDHVLGRSKSKTLKLQEDSKGLYTEITPPDAAWASDLMKSVERGDVDQMSFGFRTMKDAWHKEDGEHVRELHEVKLIDVSPVTFPAYPQTSIGVRTALLATGASAQVLDALWKLDCGLELERRDIDLIQKYADGLHERIASGEPGRAHSNEDAEPRQEAHSMQRYRDKLRLLEAEI